MNPWWIVQHVRSEGPGLLADELSKRAWPFETAPLYDGAGLPSNPDRVAGVIVLGGPMNVDEIERYPFLSSERVWLKEIISAGIPALGICLGAQLMARAMGSVVGPNPDKEIGIGPIRLTRAGIRDPVFSGVPGVFDVFHWHGDRFEIPAGSENLAESDMCNHQAFRLGSSAYGFQFHLEVTSGMADQWTQNADDELRAAGTTRQNILSDASARLGEIHRHARIIFSNFFDVIARRSRD